VAPPSRAAGHAAPYRRKRPHTTHLEGFPPAVTIIRPHHPFEGRALAVLSWTHRGGQLQLVLVLPDGSRALIPPAWTDLPDGSAAADHAHRVSLLARLADLLQARTVVDALLRRLPTAGEAQPSPSDAEEAHHANAPALSGRASPRGQRRM